MRVFLLILFLVSVVSENTNCVAERWYINNYSGFYYSQVDGVGVWGDLHNW